MANTFLPSAKQKLLNKELDVDTDTLKASIVDASYTFSSAHDFFDDVSGVIATVTVGSVTITAGVVDCADPTYTAVTTGQTIKGVMFWFDLAGGSSADPLFCFIDHDGSAAAINQATNGGDVTLQINGSGILSL